MLRPVPSPSSQASSPPWTVVAAETLRRGARVTSDWIDLSWSTVRVLLRRVAPLAKGRLLDVGCGDKPYEDIFRPYVSEYLGIEYEGTFGQTDASSRVRKPDFTYDGKRLPFDDGTFDTVLNVQVLEHTPDPGALVAEMARVLKPEGVLLLSAPFQFRLHEQPHDYFRYSPHGLRTLCDRAGLELVEVHSQGSLWSVVGHKLNSYLAFRVARVGALAQSLDKLGHEGAQRRDAVRFWTLPVVAPMMLGISAMARLLDRVAHEPEEALGFLAVARHKPGQHAESPTS